MDPWGLGGLISTPVAFIPPRERKRKAEKIKLKNPFLLSIHPVPFNMSGYNMINSNTFKFISFRALPKTSF